MNNNLPIDVSEKEIELVRGALKHNIQDAVDILSDPRTTKNTLIAATYASGLLSLTFEDAMLGLSIMLADKAVEIKEAEHGV